MDEGPRVDRRLLFKSFISPSKLLTTLLKQNITVLSCNCRGKSIIDFEDVETFIRDIGIKDVVSHNSLCSLEGIEFYKNVLNNFPRKLIVLACSKRNFKDVADEMNYPLENLYVLEIQELCGFVHNDLFKATEKAKRIIASFIAQNFSQTRKEVGGIAIARSKGLEAKDIRTLYGRPEQCLSFKGACSSCISYCPRDAISSNISLLVDRRLCNVCGVCESVCLHDVFYTFPFNPDFRLGLDYLLKESWRTLEVKKGKNFLEYNILVFACGEEVKNTFIRAGTMGQKYKEEILPIFLPSPSTITVNLILEAFSGGAQKVILLGDNSCPPKIKSYVENVVIACKMISSKLNDRIRCFWIRENDITTLLNILGEETENVELEMLRKQETIGDYDGKRDELVELIISLSDKEMIPSSKLTPFGFIGINKSDCSLCGKCANICPTKALTFHEGHIYFDHSKCVGCSICESACDKKLVKCYQEIRTSFLDKSIKVV
ncbi:MAG: 4Fe-4S binding protein [Nitrososphaeria archaeon]